MSLPVKKIIISIIAVAVFIDFINGNAVPLDDYEKMKAAALRRKEDEILGKWFVTAKEDVFIDIDPAYDRCNVLQEK